MMEKKYVTPDMEIKEFETQDVITTSGTGEGGDEDIMDGDED